MKTYKSTVTEYSLKYNKSDINKSKILSAKDAHEYVKQFYFDDINIYESFFIMMLNRANNVIGYAKISQGGTAGTVIDIKLIAKYAVDSLADSLILIHNHPSGNVKPSTADINITTKIKDGLKLLDITVLDHIIISENNYYSFGNEGII